MGRVGLVAPPGAPDPRCRRPHVPTARGVDHRLARRRNVLRPPHRRGRREAAKRSRIAAVNRCGKPWIEMRVPMRQGKGRRCVLIEQAAVRAGQPGEHRIRCRHRRQGHEHPVRATIGDQAVRQRHRGFRLSATRQVFDDREHRPSWKSNLFSPTLDRRRRLYGWEEPAQTLPLGRCRCGQAGQPHRLHRSGQRQFVPIRRSVGNSSGSRVRKPLLPRPYPIGHRRQSRQPPRQPDDVSLDLGTDQWVWPEQLDKVANEAPGHVLARVANHVTAQRQVGFRRRSAVMTGQGGIKVRPLVLDANHPPRWAGRGQAARPARRAAA